NLIQGNYPGAIYFVNPKGGSLLGRKVYTNILEVPEPVDLAILLVPAPYIPNLLRDCGRRGISAAIIGAGGFRETGEAGAALEEECVAIARKYFIRLLGPNCIGIMDTHLPLDATFLPPPPPRPGDVAFVSHSGAIIAAVVDWARGQDLGLSRLISLGNQADICEADVLAPLALDAHTRVITLYLEGVRDGRRFVREAAKVARVKPIVALKVGRFASGQRAVASHTGALAGRESAFNAAFWRAGVIRAETSEEMFDWARALAWSPLPKGRSIAILTSAGGPGVTAADALEANGMRLAELKPETVARLRQILPAAASFYNPVDMLATATPEQYAACLQAMLEDGGVHGALVIVPPLPMQAAGAIAKALIPVIYNSDKPVAITLMGDRLIQEAIEHFRAARIPEYRFPERAASALAILAQRADFLARPVVDPQPVEDVDREKVERLLRPYLEEAKASGTTVPLPAEVVAQILEAYGISTLAVQLVRTAQEAVQVAERMGYPVVLKVASTTVTHKSDIGGVLLNLLDADSVAQGFEVVLQNVSRAYPEAEVEGVYLQRMLPLGQEVIVGAIQDEQFGALVMFGSGGVEVEALRDVGFALAPITDHEIEHLLSTTWAGRRLCGYRNLPPADRQAVVEVLRRVAQLAADFPQLAEIEINPLKVFEEGKGATAIDVRARVKGESSSSA
ncbi:MAG: acetate--CoA ligase family protein, partial [Anaerolineales bacterium]|nr:acetate--CoA ligase family protein [Anaerolineales bacterium]MDW8447345.1 acetate--CoA ligase family protein [Anaerolineales bacterium]